MRKIPRSHPHRARRRITSVKHSIDTSLGTVAVRVQRASALRPGESPAPWVFLHGASGSWRTFRAQTSLTHTSRPAPGRASTGTPQRRATTSNAPYDLVFLDLPGWGNSDSCEAFTVQQQSRAVVEALTALNYRSWYLFGHSMGAVLALDIAASYPNHTQAVVALSPTALTARAALTQPLRNPAMAPLIGMHALMLLLRVFGRLTPALLRLVERSGLLRIILSPLFARPFSLRRQVFEDLAVDVRPASFLAASSALRDYDAGAWQSITAPTILARGAGDVFTRPAELRALAAVLRHAHVVVLPATGHFAHIEDPAAVDALLSRLRPAADSLNVLHGRHD